MIELLAPVPLGTRISQEWKPGEHNGVDFACAIGTPLVAPTDGEVLFAGFLSSSPSSGMAVGVAQNVGGVKVYWSFSHCSHLEPGIAPGARVRRGQRIARSGNTGDVRGRRKDGSVGPPTAAEPNIGAHLHFRVDLDNKNTNPLPLLVWPKPGGGGGGLVLASLVGIWAAV